MKKMPYLFWTLLAVTSTVALPAYAYLVPVIGGAIWLIAIIAGGLATLATFIWLNVLKFKQGKKKPSKDAETATAEAKDDDGSV